MKDLGDLTLKVIPLMPYLLGQSDKTAGCYNPYLSLTCSIQSFIP